MLKACSGALVILLLIGQSLFAATIHVPGDQPNIQAGINATLIGDTVLVAPNTYTGTGNRDLTFSGKDIVLLSESGPENTIIDAEASKSDPHRCMLFTDGETTDARVIGLTFRGGYVIGSDHGLEGNGGGVICLYSSPTFENCVFTQNTSNRHGGGLYCEYGASPNLTSCKFINNTALQNGGAFASEGAFSVLENCIFEGNSAEYSGALHLGSGSDLTITGCLIYANSSQIHGGAAGLFGSSPTFQNCTLASNDYNLGQVYCSTGSSPIINNSIIALGSGTAAVYCTGSAATLYCCDVYGNVGGDWTYCLTGLEGVDGNFSSNPFFCDLNNYDFHVLNLSDCLPENNDCGELVGAFGQGCSTDMAIFDPFPSSFYFQSTAFEPDLIIDTLNVTNIGTEPLNWTASWNADWLEVVPASGTAPSIVEISASAETLSAGRYNDQIMLEAPNAFNSPVKINVVFQVGSDCKGRCGDCNNDGKVNVSDALWIINFVFIDGLYPLPVMACGNANGDTAIGISDAVYIINFVFVGGNAPGNCHPGVWFLYGGDCCPY